MDPESAHERALRLLELAQKTPWTASAIRGRFAYRDPSLRVRVAGLDFENPVGLAAGFDKDCRLAGILPAFGFGFLELGTVTPRPQEGNPRPRLFRYPGRFALVNRMGFNNEGAEAAARRLARSGPRTAPLGVSIGVNAEVAPEDAPAEYAKAFAALAPYADYLALNVSSPNTRGLRRLQEKLRLERILTALSAVNALKRPLFVKLSPDLETEEVENIIPVVRGLAQGVICANTTLSREGAPEAAEQGGGLSGAPLLERSARLIREVRRVAGPSLPIIGSGGVFGAADAYRRQRAGASLIQVYTGVVYRGFGLVQEINRGLAGLLKDHGLSRLDQAVGAS